MEGGIKFLPTTLLVKGSKVKDSKNIMLSIIFPFHPYI
jgi:hypothetical protein